MFLAVLRRLTVFRVPVVWHSTLVIANHIWFTRLFVFRSRTQAHTVAVVSVTFFRELVVPVEITVHQNRGNTLNDGLICRV